MFGNSKTKKIEIVGVLGDVHAQDATLQIALDFLTNRSNLDAVLCTGDILDGDGSAERCCDLLQTAGVLCVRGNHERWHFETEPFMAEIIALAQPENLATWPVPLSASARAYLASLPSIREFQTPCGELLLCHGLGTDDMACVFPYEEQTGLKERLAQYGLENPFRYRFVINGHTHQRMVRRIGSVTLINAGTLLPQPEASCVIMDFKVGRIEFYRINPNATVMLSQIDHLETEDFVDKS